MGIKAALKQIRATNCKPEVKEDLKRIFIAYAKSDITPWQQHPQEETPQFKLGDIVKWKRFEGEALRIGQIVDILPDDDFPITILYWDGDWKACRLAIDKIIRKLYSIKRSEETMKETFTLKELQDLAEQYRPICYSEFHGTGRCERCILMMYGVDQFIGKLERL